MSSSNIAQDFSLDLFDLPSQSPLMDDLTSPIPSMMVSPLTDDFVYMASSSATVPPGTVSPKDLMSGPPSSFSTELATPQSTFDSPGDLSFSHFTSPVFGTDHDLPADHNDWTSLFPDQVISCHDFNVMPSLSEQKLSNPVPSGIESSAASPNSSEDASSPKASTGASSVHKSKNKRDLRDLDFDPTDPVAVKRARNTLAARKSREKKVQMQRSLQNRIDELEKELAESKKEAEMWKARAQATGL